MNNGTVQDREVQWFRKDGSIAWVTINGRSVKDGSGKVIHYERGCPGYHRAQVS